MRALMAAAMSRGIVLRALKVAAIVGTILNAVNQGRTVLAGHGVLWAQLALNFVVPYCVATYSAAQEALTKENC